MRAGRVTPVLHLHSRAREAAVAAEAAEPPVTQKGVPQHLHVHLPSLSPHPLASSHPTVPLFFHSNPFYTPVVKGAVSAVCKVTSLLPCGCNHSEHTHTHTPTSQNGLCLHACVCVWRYGLSLTPVLLLHPLSNSLSKMLKVCSMSVFHETIWGRKTNQLSSRDYVILPCCM